MVAVDGEAEGAGAVLWPEMLGPGGDVLAEEVIVGSAYAAPEFVDLVAEDGALDD